MWSIMKYYKITAWNWIIKVNPKKELNFYIFPLTACLHWFMKKCHAQEAVVMNRRAVITCQKLLLLPLLFLLLQSLLLIFLFLLLILFFLFSLLYVHLLILLLHLFLCNLSSSLLAYLFCPSLAVICDWVNGNVNCRNCSCVWDLSKLSIEYSAGLPVMYSNLIQVNFLMWNHVERRTLLSIPCGGGHRSWDWTLEGRTFRFIYLKDKMVHIYTCVMDDLVKPVLQVEYSACYSILSY